MFSPLGDHFMFSSDIWEEILVVFSFYPISMICLILVSSGL